MEENFSSGSDSFGSEDTSKDSGSKNDINELLRQSPFGVLSEVVDDLSTIFNGVGAPSDSGSNPFGGGSSSMSGDDLPYGGNPFAGDNFWNIFAGGVKPG